MKKILISSFVFALLLLGCSNSKEDVITVYEDILNKKDDIEDLGYEIIELSDGEGIAIDMGNDLAIIVHKNGNIMSDYDTGGFINKTILKVDGTLVTDENKYDGYTCNINDDCNANGEHEYNSLKDLFDMIGIDVEDSKYGFIK